MAGPPPLLNEIRVAPEERSNQGEHVAGDWYSVPDLSLRDNRFTVPLDHFDPDSAAKITVFAREVVAGNPF